MTECKFQVGQKYKTRDGKYTYEVLAIRNDRIVIWCFDATPHAGARYLNGRNSLAWETDQDLMPPNENELLRDAAKALREASYEFWVLVSNLRGEDEKEFYKGKSAEMEHEAQKIEWFLAL